MELECPYYLAIGMTYEQYWYGDPLMVRDYRKAYRLRRNMADEEAWMHGLYVLRALDAIVGNVFRKEGQQQATYPEEPMSLTQIKEEQRRKRETSTENEALWAKAWMSSFVQAGKNWGKNKKQEG